MKFISSLIASIAIFLGISHPTPVPTPLPTSIPSSTVTAAPSVSPQPSPTLKPIPRATVKPTGRAPFTPVACEGTDGGECARITRYPTATADKAYDTRYKNVTIVVNMKTTVFCSQNTTKTVEISSSPYKVLKNDTTDNDYLQTTGTQVKFTGLYSGFYRLTVNYCTDRKFTIDIGNDENMLPGVTIIRNVELLDNPPSYIPG